MPHASREEVGDPAVRRSLAQPSLGRNPEIARPVGEKVAHQVVRQTLGRGQVGNHLLTPQAENAVVGGHPAGSVRREAQVPARRSDPESSRKGHSAPVFRYVGAAIRRASRSSRVSSSSPGPRQSTRSSLGRRGEGGSGIVGDPGPRAGSNMLKPLHRCRSRAGRRRSSKRVTASSTARPSGLPYSAKRASAEHQQAGGRGHPEISFAVFTEAIDLVVRQTVGRRERDRSLTGTRHIHRPQTIEAAAEGAHPKIAVAVFEERRSPRNPPDRADETPDPCPASQFRRRANRSTDPPARAMSQCNPPRRLANPSASSKCRPSPGSFCR